MKMYHLQGSASSGGSQSRGQVCFSFCTVFSSAAVRHSQFTLTLFPSQELFSFTTVLFAQHVIFFSCVIQARAATSNCLNGTCMGGSGPALVLNIFLSCFMNFECGK